VRLRRLGTLIGPYDPMIAGCALNRGLVLVTSSTAEFKRLGKLKLEDWRS
jgi:tRNA(fMet)-specific endonuclease VapC